MVELRFLEMPAAALAAMKLKWMKVASVAPPQLQWKPPGYAMTKELGCSQIFYFLRLFFATFTLLICCDILMWLLCSIIYLIYAIRMWIRQFYLIYAFHRWIRQEFY